MNPYTHPPYYNASPLIVLAPAMATALERACCGYCPFVAVTRSSDLALHVANEHIHLAHPEVFRGVDA